MSPLSTDATFHQYRLTRTTLANYQIGFSLFEGGSNTFKDFLSVEGFDNILNFNHIKRSFVKIRSKRMIRMLL